ncbi:acyl-CoA thioesterase [Leptospira gomenensis]|uniref:Acyl-CoA thioesterase n=1 Tax=Leptospira gomenensis TaxID=2484974 RepID=A0A5F1YK92_9LEPT|nr:thioesterase family protein [Leptospira gomenensis]TGK33359.1 acyl-CoA thioesterase [Leptospira gomenensis]TGK37346.1 acyl-CoA thioesterase [Leptospira gomenensis]TGK40535.1 acyl-CoA thioesterase [Leptospira gomenensis]TGK56457.1 acyl-CoA thioesterase [Leptospira gomenensis]
MEENFRFKHRIPVRFSDTDVNGHVNNRNYNSYCDEAKMSAFVESGVDLDTMKQNGIGPIVYKAEYEYLSDLKYPDQVIVKTKVEFIKRTRAVFIQELRRESDDSVVCRVKSYGMWINFFTKKPAFLPEEVLQKMGEWKSKPESETKEAISV